jgi:hypothetical protein
MILFINPDNNLLVGDPLFRNPIRKILYKRRDGGVVRLGFAGEPQADPSRMLKIGVKPYLDFDAPDFLVYANSYYTLPDSPFYYIAPNFNTVAINSLFTPNLTSVLVSLEVSWSADSGVTWDSSQVVDVEIFNDLIQGGEFFPTPLSSFESQIIPILASFVHPINVFDNDLTVSNGSIVVSGSASYISTPSLFTNTLSAQTFVSDSISSVSVNTNTLVSNTLDSVSGNINSLTSVSIDTNTITSVSGNINSLSANTIFVNELNALSANIAVINITQYELSGFHVKGNFEVDGILTANALSSNTIKTVSISATNAFVPNVFTNNLILSTILATSIKTTTLSAVNFDVSNITSVGINTNSLTATNIYTNVLSADFVISNNSFATNGSVGALLANSVNTGFLQVSDNKFKILSSYTPTGTADAFGTVGTITWDADRIYLKTLTGWKRSNQFLNF